MTESLTGPHCEACSREVGRPIGPFYVYQIAHLEMLGRRQYFSPLLSLRFCVLERMSMGGGAYYAPIPLHVCGLECSRKICKAGQFIIMLADGSSQPTRVWDHTGQEYELAWRPKGGLARRLSLARK